MRIKKKINENNKKVIDKEIWKCYSITIKNTYIKTKIHESVYIHEKHTYII